MPTVVLGTAQWGNSYGITNRVGRIPDADIVEISSIAAEMGIGMLDTAPGYGDAESRIGLFAETFSVQTKISIHARSSENLSGQLQSSMQALRRDLIDAVLIHDWHEAGPKSRNLALDFLKDRMDEGSLGRVGVSIYTAKDLEGVAEKRSRISTVQVPLNVLDQRFDQNSLIDELRAGGMVVQARSVFLQGVLTDPEAAGSLANHPDVVRFLESHDRDLVHTRNAALNFVRSRDWVDQVLLAVCSSSELSELDGAWHQPLTSQEWESFASHDLDLIDPRNWVRGSDT
jgi:aryl-alcohol dehydrogenase-like predicted oxidoreductase